MCGVFNTLQHDTSIIIRYAMKRMRRKFKAMQRDIDGKAVDWRTLYMESKQAEEADGLKNKKRKLKKQKDKNADKREKERQKRYDILIKC